MNVSQDAASFADLALRPELLRVLSGLGYEEPTPIQREAIPPLVQERDLLGQAATGTGKTAAFALPLLQRMAGDGRGAGPVALVLVPTRELAMQVSHAFHRYGRDLGVRVLPIYGGQPIGRQLQALERGVDVVVATPGRAIDHIGRGTLRLRDVETVVLDEADEMLDMGFAEDIEAILDGTPEDRQTVLFSATMPSRVDGIARRHLRDPVRIEMGRAAPAAGTVPLVRQSAYVVARAQKPAALGRVLDVQAPSAAIVFCRTREEVDQLTETLNGRGYRAEALHGGMGQEQRDRVMGRLRSGTAELLIATDLAARGLDFEQLTHVVNYDVPSAPDAYVHRIGRVGRGGREGVAITLAEPREHRMLKVIERVTKQRITVEKVPTIADLRARRLELTRAALQESLLTDDLDRFRVVVETLADEFDVMDVALAAVKLAHESSGREADEEEIPEVADATVRNRPDIRGADGRERRRGRAETGGMTRVFLGVGRSVGIRPQDLVGAITGESHLGGRDIGAIEIADRFSLVEVPESAADDVIAALRHTTIKGKSRLFAASAPRRVGPPVRELSLQASADERVLGAAGRSVTQNGPVGDTRLPRSRLQVVCPFMTTSTRTRTVLFRAGLVLATTGALAFSSACNDSSPLEGGTGGNQEQEEDDSGGNEQDDD
ncbi:MAG: DEAD/DEAH box helicase [Actinomycetota bacterium]|nr:DEAD/DEAH box helicase [Actinomycetota bacterium]